MKGRVLEKAELIGTYQKSSFTIYPMPRTTGPRFVAETLRGYGTRHVFFVPQMLLETLTGMEGMGIRRVANSQSRALLKLTAES